MSDDGFRAAAVLVIDDQGRLLLQQRDDDVPPAGVGRWAIPGGGREGAESPRETALREIEEETGFRPPTLRYWGETASWKGHRHHVFLAPGGPPRSGIEVNEGLDFQYWTVDELDGLLMAPRTRELIAEIIESQEFRAIADPPAVAIIALSRFGDVLLARRDGGAWSVPNGRIGRGEGPDSAALRVFGELTGYRLDGLKLYGRLGPTGPLAGAPATATHVYYDDPDLDPARLDPPDGVRLGSRAPASLDQDELEPWVAALLDEFTASSAYRALFH